MGPDTPCVADDWHHAECHQGKGSYMQQQHVHRAMLFATGPAQQREASFAAACTPSTSCSEDAGRSAAAAHCAAWTVSSVIFQLEAVGSFLLLCCLESAWVEFQYGTC
eukprot:GHRQ01033953.1.p1 GENE.GHRQ01033953.1~~GHRQ01033953.1.p1  ORF type:complete len:108 (-),score=28.27 GHRQ01033953.1:208-531(-)